MSEILFSVCVTIATFGLGLAVGSTLVRHRARRYLLRVRRELPSLALTIPMIADLQLGICAVGSGRNNVAMLGFDHIDNRGVGSLVITVTSGTVFNQVVGPAIQARFGAMRPVS